MIFRIDEDRVVWASRHAGFAADANRFIKVNDSVCALEHSSGRARGDARRMRALIAARHLVRPASLRKDSDIDVFDVSPGHADRHNVFRLACSGACVTTDTAGMVDYLGPLNGGLGS